MTKDEIVQKAMEFADYDQKSQCYVFNGNGKFSVLSFAASIIAATKDEDARICDKWNEVEAQWCAEAIRESKQE